MQKPQQEKNEEEHLPDHHGGASRRTNCMSPVKKQAGHPKNFHQQASVPLQHSSKPVKSTQELSSTRHCFSPGLWHYTVTAGIFRLIKWAKIQLSLKAKEAEVGRRGGYVCIRQLIWKKGPESISHTSYSPSAFLSFLWKNSKHALGCKSVWSPSIAHGQYGRRVLWSQAVFQGSKLQVSYRTLLINPVAHSTACYKFHQLPTV